MGLLILGGTGEGRALAAALHDMPGAQLAMAGTTAHPETQALPVHRGGFGGIAGMEAFLRAERVTGVLDATHPFATQITANARAACDASGVPYRQYLRPAWQPRPGEAWRLVPDAQAAAAAVPEGAVVLWTLGRKGLADLGGLAASRVLIRLVDPPRQAFPLPNGRYLVARPPFSLPEEIALMRRERVSVLVTKNSGGAVGRTKLDAARQLGVRVVMVSRPEAPGDRVLDTLEAAEAWVREGCEP